MEHKLKMLILQTLALHIMVMHGELSSYSLFPETLELRL
jgi:hypothetical protein